MHYDERRSYRQCTNSHSLDSFVKGWPPLIYGTGKKFKRPISKDVIIHLQSHLVYHKINDSTVRLHQVH